MSSLPLSLSVSLSLSFDFFPPFLLRSLTHLGIHLIERSDLTNSSRFHSSKTRETEYRMKRTQKIVYICVCTNICTDSVIRLEKIVGMYVI